LFCQVAVEKAPPNLCGRCGGLRLHGYDQALVRNQGRLAVIRHFQNDVNGVGFSVLGHGKAGGLGGVLGNL
jgi:hypothetical protein